MGIYQSAKFDLGMIAKIIGSFIVLIAYSLYLYLKNRKQIYGRTLAYINIGSFLIVLINFFLFGSLSSFHIWKYYRRYIMRKIIVGSRRSKLAIPKRTG